MAVRFSLNRRCTGFFENFSANLLLKDTVPDASITICEEARVTGGVIGVQKSSFVILAKSNIAIIFLSVFLKQKTCILTI